MNQYGKRPNQDPRRRQTLPRFDPRDNLLLNKLTSKYPILHSEIDNTNRLTKHRSLWMKITTEFNKKALQPRPRYILQLKFKSISQKNNTMLRKPSTGVDGPPPRRIEEVVRKRKNVPEYEQRAMRNVRSTKRVQNANIFDEISELGREKRDQETQNRKDAKDFFIDRMREYRIAKLNLFNAHVQFMQSKYKLEKRYFKILERYKKIVGRDFNPLSRVLKKASQKQVAVEQKETEKGSKEWTAVELEKFDDDLNFFLEGTNLQISAQGDQILNDGKDEVVEKLMD